MKRTRKKLIRNAARRGFAAMPPDTQRRICRMGGIAVSRNRRHMAQIGAEGGRNSHGKRVRKALKAA